MKTFFAALLLVATLCVGKVCSRLHMCYRCEAVLSSDYCWTTRLCTDKDMYCFSTLTAKGSGKDTEYRISKGCSPTCQEKNEKVGNVSVSIKCCSTSTCNTETFASGATSVKMSSVVMAVAIMASFLCISQSR